MTETLRERRRRLLSEEILEHARLLIGAKGFGAFSMEALATQIGISKPTLYSHFANKDELLLAAITQKMDQMIAFVEDANAHGPLMRLQLAMTELLQRRVEAEGAAMRPWPELMELMCKHPESLERMRRMQQGVTTLVVAGRADGTISTTLPVNAVVRSFFALATSLNRHPADPLEFEAIDDGVDAIVTIFVRGIRSS